MTALACKSELKSIVLILAAGESKRMGSIKQLLPWGRTNLLGNAIQTALRSEIMKAYVVLGANAEVIAKQTDLSQVKTMTNSNWKQGMGTSISCGVRKILAKEKGVDAILVMLADQPYMTPTHLNLMVSSFIQSKKGIVATSNENGVGVPALFDKIYFERLLQLEGHKGARKVIATNLMDMVLLDGANITIDLDIKEVYLDAVKKTFG